MRERGQGMKKGGSEGEGAALRGNEEGGESEGEGGSIKCAYM